MNYIQCSEIRTNVYKTKQHELVWIWELGVRKQSWTEK